MVLRVAIESSRDFPTNFLAISVLLSHHFLSLWTGPAAESLCSALWMGGPGSIIFIFTHISMQRGWTQSGQWSHCLRLNFGSGLWTVGLCPPRTWQSDPTFLSRLGSTCKLCEGERHDSTMKGPLHSISRGPGADRPAPSYHLHPNTRVQTLGKVLCIASGVCQCLPPTSDFCPQQGLQKGVLGANPLVSQLQDIGGTGDIPRTP